MPCALSWYCNGEVHAPWLELHTTDSSLFTVLVCLTCCRHRLYNSRQGQVKVEVTRKGNNFKMLNRLI